MALNYNDMKRLPMDPKMVREISRSPQMSAEQGGFLSGWGGSSGYIKFAKMPTNERLVYAAVLEGNTDSSAIEVVTGLSGKEVNGALSKLGRQGLVEVEK